MSWSKARDIVWTALGVAGLFYVAGSVLGLVASGVLLLVLGALIAFVLSPVVAWTRRRCGLRQSAAAAIVYSVLLAFLGTLGTLGVSALGAQIAALPTALREVQDRLPTIEAEVRAFGLGIDVRQMLTDALVDVQRSGLASQGIAWAGALGISAVNAFLVLVLSFYLVVDGGRLFETALTLAPARGKAYLLFAEKTLVQVVRGYLRGQVAMGAIVASAVFLLCLLLGVRYSAVIALIAFAAEFMPMVGPFVTSLAVTTAGFVDSLRLALLAPALYLGLRTTAVYLLGPRIIHRTVGVHPIATTLGLVLGAKLFGVWGVVFAAPVLGFAFVIVGAVYRELLVQSRAPLPVAHRPTLAPADDTRPEAPAA